MIIILRLLLGPWIGRLWRRSGSFDERLARTETAFWFVVTAIGGVIVIALALQVFLPPPAPVSASQPVGDRAVVVLPAQGAPRV